MQPQNISETLSPDARETLNDILAMHKSGQTSEEAAVFQIVELFKRQPVNYKRVYSDKGQQAHGSGAQA